MGLQFYRNPEDVDAENAAAAKLDRATAQRRSAIRRESSIRPRREQSSLTNLSNIIRNRYDMQQLHGRLHRDNVEADAQIAQLEAELQVLRRQRERTANRMERHRAQIDSEESRSLQSSADSPNSTASDDPTLTAQEGRSSDSEVHAQVLLPRPARESNLRFEIAATSTSRPSSPRHVSTMPSPPHSLDDNPTHRPVDGPLDGWDSVPALSEDFAPARAARAAIEQAESALNAAAESMRETSTAERPGLETPPPETWESSYPPLRRVPHMSPRPLPRTPVDGLGDRHRSPSPASDNQEESTWNQLLSTLDQSDEAPSTSTSFASMTDLLSTSRSSSYRSSNTQNTSTSFGEIGSSSDETCDLPPGITEADVRMIRERHRRTARHRLQQRIISASGYNDRGHSMDSEPVGGRGMSRTGSDMSRLLMDQVEQRLQQDREGGTGLVPRLDAFHDILERMQRREHVPDDLWTVVGLSPDYFGRT